jgi:hypothetical protein
MGFLRIMCSFDRTKIRRTIPRQLRWHGLTRSSGGVLLLETDEDESTRPKAWSDLVTFWDSPTEEELTLEIETRIENDVRRWYMVVALDNRARILHRSLIP